MNLSQVAVRPVEPPEETKYQGLIEQYQYLGDFSHRKNSVPSESTIRYVLIGINPTELDQALQQWNVQYRTIH